MSQAETLPAPSIVGGTLRGLAAYLARPTLIAPIGLRSSEGWQRLAILVALHVSVLLLAVLPLMVAWQSASGIAGPDAFEQIPEGWFLPLTMLIMPVLEELFFRGWLTGRKRALWLLACAAVVLVSVLSISGDDIPPAVLVGVLGGLLAAPVGWLVLRKKLEPPRWFVSAFPAIFYLAVAGFAVVHLSNYSSWSLGSVPLVLPQLWAGLMLGYIRMRIGLVGSIIAHIASNSAVLVLTPILT